MYSGVRQPSVTGVVVTHRVGKVRSDFDKIKSNSGRAGHPFVIEESY